LDLFAGGNIFHFLFNLFGAVSPAACVFWILFAVTQTFGLLFITLADADLNRFMQRNPFRAVWQLVAFLAFECVLTGSRLFTYQHHHKLNSTLRDPILSREPEIWLSVCIQALPVGYLLFRFSAVLGMKEGYPLFSELLLVTLAMDLVMNYGVSAKIPYKKSVSTKVSCALWIAGAVSMILLYMRRRRRGESPTLALKASILVYLLLLGGLNFESRIVARVRGEKEPLAWILYGTCASLPCMF
jgi:hypothetical protein